MRPLGYVLGAAVSLTGGLADLAYINLALVPRMIDQPEVAAGAPAIAAVVEAPAVEAPEPIEAPAIEPERPRRISYELAGVVRFRTGSDVLDRRARAELERVAKLLLADPEAIARADGHADARGPSPYNQALSDRRADTVARALEELGVEPSRIGRRGFGESLAGEEWFRDRRVEISIGRRERASAEHEPKNGGPST
jgi:outer membrane protein OmpA-like peptidoglycan-associated protein